MSRFAKLLETVLLPAATAFLTAAMLLPNMAQAMEIRQFDKMASQDRSEYVAELALGAQKVLTDAGKADQAAHETETMHGIWKSNARSLCSGGLPKLIPIEVGRRLRNRPNDFHRRAHL
jgi:hypothetical protein